MHFLRLQIGLTASTLNLRIRLDPILLRVMDLGDLAMRLRRNTPRLFNLELDHPRESFPPLLQKPHLPNFLPLPCLRLANSRQSLSLRPLFRHFARCLNHIARCLSLSSLSVYSFRSSRNSNSNSFRNNRCNSRNPLRLSFSTLSPSYPRNKSLSLRNRFRNQLNPETRPHSDTTWRPLRGQPQSITIRRRLRRPTMVLGLRIRIPLRARIRKS